ncbi:LRP2 [Lepeophtheirus salmonis]|uniref:LRP2 n=1 Tax=Lepeophtheirus salmonis TaxID=72036 RepID=A0A7R8D6V0_LEPSM|nr:LRP2 [Lepeophtheirus salmonis]CAF3021176.1 LRP2 [Lepeophtheirus salmonis]
MMMPSMGVEDVVLLVFLQCFFITFGNTQECTNVYKGEVVNCHTKCSNNRRPYFVPEDLYPPGALQAGLCVSEEECVRLNSILNDFDHYKSGRWICTLDSTCIPTNRACEDGCYSPTAMKLVRPDCKGLVGQNVTKKDSKARQVHLMKKTLSTLDKISAFQRRNLARRNAQNTIFIVKIDEECIPLRWVCDGSKNLGCSDKSDELECGTCADGMVQCDEDGGKIRCKTSNFNVTCNGECSLGYYKCGEGKCVSNRESSEERCDGVRNCEDGADEKSCSGCKDGSELCGNRLICKGSFCGVTEESEEKVPKKRPSSPEDCSCDQYWCPSESRCVPRDITKIQTCDGLLSGYPSVDQTVFKNVSGSECDAGIWEGNVFKQGSCLPDKIGLCPTSFRVSDNAIKLWSKCGGACWSRDIVGDKVPKRYGYGMCHQESFNALCSGKCKYYKAWFCGEDIICTDTPCEGTCPEGLYLYGNFRCGTKCLHPNKVCDGSTDCSNGMDENPKFYQKCNEKCQTMQDGTSLIDCGYESERKHLLHWYKFLL